MLVTAVCSEYIIVNTMYCQVTAANVMVWIFYCRYSAGEIHFNLMAIVSDRKLCYEKRLQELCAQSEVTWSCTLI